MPAPISSTPSTEFGVVEQIDAGVLSVGYVEDGPADGPAAVLLHGWPYDIFSYVDVVPLLTAAGYRVIVPYLRGFGSTRFLSGKPRRRSGASTTRRSSAARRPSTTLTTSRS
jgi:pimeloyl-ACP methyl ester carboxylesterase